MRSLNNFEFVNVTSAGTITSDPINLNAISLAFIQLIISGSGISGTLTLEASGDLSSPTNWDEVPDSSVAITVSRTVSYNLSDMGMQWVRVKFVPTGGTITIIGRVNKKRWYYDN